MFQPIQKGYLLYYLALLFLVYPFAGALWLGYPLWTLIPTSLFLLAYLMLVHIKAEYPKTIALLWLYSLSYVVFMTCVYDSSFMWFFFFQSNLVNWHFCDEVKSYRMISFLAALLGTMLYGELFLNNLIGRIMLIVISLFVFLMTYSQYNLRLEKEMEEELYKQNETINLLAAENERNRIGRDLHDTLGHTFAMMTLKTELALKQLDKERMDAVRKELLELNQISRKSMKEVRQLINNLKYRTVAEELNSIADMFALSDIELTVDNQMNLEALSPIIQSSMTMILRELTTNIIKHAKAKNCQITLLRADKLVIEVSDDGCGFASLTGDELHSVKERLQLVNGQVAIVSLAEPTLVRVTLEEGEGS